MANQKEIRGRIASTISTQQITKAMKLVSATKLRRAGEGIMRMRPYAQKLQGIMANLQDSVDDDRLVGYFKEREVKKVLIVAISSDRGLCGAFNANVVKRTRAIIDSKYADAKKAGNVTILVIGKKAGELLKKQGYKVDTTYVTLLQGLDSDSAFAAAEEILNSYSTHQYDRIEIVFNQFKNAATQILKNEVWLPILREDLVKGKKGKSQNNDYLFEPGKIEILQDLIPRSLKTQFYRAMLDSLASEHGARMVAMDKATENAGDLLKALRLAYNQARQAAITNEISEIVGGAAALEG
ncbi:MAG: ATP synthase F1 subunit gamma [Bacteroidetes bacterium]|nr:ATP synthase F1 subunit gamma [Bacteroidota bacterium]